MGQNFRDRDIAWAKILTRALSDPAFERKVIETPAIVFKEYGVTVPEDFDPDKHISPPLRQALSGRYKSGPIIARNVAGG